MGWLVSWAQVVDWTGVVTGFRKGVDLELDLIIQRVRLEFIKSIRSNL